MRLGRDAIRAQVEGGAQAIARADLASATATVAAYLGTDANAAALAYGAANVSGSVVTQWVGPGWLPGVVYRLTITATTTLGATISIYAHIACNPIN